jgi:hypothetical protein
MKVEASRIRTTTVHGIQIFPSLKLSIGTRSFMAYPANKENMFAVLNIEPSDG